MGQHSLYATLRRRAQGEKFWGTGNKALLRTGEEGQPHL